MSRLETREPPHVPISSSRVGCHHLDLRFIDGSGVRLKQYAKMTASLLSVTEQLGSRAWFLHAEFHVACHTQIVDIATKRIISEYVQNIIAACAPYFNKHLKALALLAISMPTDISCLRNREVVPVFGVLYD